MINELAEQITARRTPWWFLCHSIDHIMNVQENIGDAIASDAIKILQRARREWILDNFSDNLVRLIGYGAIAALLLPKIAPFAASLLTSFLRAYYAVAVEKAFVDSKLNEINSLEFEEILSKQK